MKNKIIITAPMPPPIHGMSLATSMLIDGLSQSYNITKIDTTMNRSVIAVKQPSLFVPSRFFKILSSLFFDSWLMFTTRYDIHYLCTGADFRGIIRYLPYIIISIIKNKPFIIHIHNGAFKHMYDKLSNTQRGVINYIFRKAYGVIVLGNSLKYMFNGVVDSEKIFVVENCVDNEFIATKKDIENKITAERRGVIKVLYLSNLMRDKGVIELMEAVSTIDNCELHLAGAIEDDPITKKMVASLLEENKTKFFYHGSVSGRDKIDLLKGSDIFALPSRYRIEGQPISILEAYANGLAVVTDSSCGGIIDIFRDGVNGTDCNSRDSESIKNAIIECSTKLDTFIEVNYNYAMSKFKRSDFSSRIKVIFEEMI